LASKQVRLQASTNCIQSAKIVMHLHHEMALHISYCQELGITKEEMESAEEDEGTVLLLNYAKTIRLTYQIKLAQRILGSYSYPP
jgi:hydroxymethylpyrimidine/phosphomethylpyrimidine kinase / thiaminase